MQLGWHRRGHAYGPRRPSPNKRGLALRRYVEEPRQREAMIEVPTLYRATGARGRCHEWALLSRRRVRAPQASASHRGRRQHHCACGGPLLERLGEPRLRNTPGPVGDLFMLDDSKALGPTDGTLFRTVVGKLLYIAAERPDVQAVGYPVPGVQGGSANQGGTFRVLNQHLVEAASE